MKKAISTIGLFSLIMILTSFTSPETINTTRHIIDNDITFELNGNQASGGNKKMDLNGNQASGGNKKMDLNGNQASGGNKKMDLNGNQASGGNKKMD